ncbi:MAG: right-handed parallel beta-helix repeat-containing protein [Panacagrimonas sp.]
MNIRRLSLGLVLAVGCTLSSAAWSASYFVDSVAGNDSFSGLAESAAWKTIAKVNGTANIPFGSTIFLKRGSVWREQLTLPSNGLTIDAYGTGVLPTFNSSVPVSGWESNGNGIYSKVVPLAPPGVGGLGNVTENGVMMTHVSWNGSGTGSLNAAPLRSFTFNFFDNRLYIKPTTAPAGNVYLASTLQAGIRAEGRSDINIQNVNVTRSSLHGIALNNCDRCSVRNSTISDGGGAVTYQFSNPYLYTGNGVEYSGRSDGGLVDNVRVTNMFDSGVSPQTFVPNSRVNGITFQNLTLERNGYAGVEMSVLPSGAYSTLSNITVSNVTIVDTGRGWSGNRYGSTGHGVLIQTTPGAGVMSGIQVGTTTIINSTGDGIRFFGEVGVLFLSRLIIAGNQYGINASSNPGTASSMLMVLTDGLIFLNRNYGLVYNSSSSQGFHVFHNTFYNNGGGINFAVYGQNGRGFIYNNIYASTTPMRQLYVDNPGGLVGANVNNNCYVTGPNMIRYRNVEYATLPPLAAATGLESRGVTTTDVKFKNPGGFDFGLQATSPCVGIGAFGTGVATDLFGVPFRNPPSAGALERVP